MDISLILKIAGVGLLAAVVNMILSKAGKDEMVMLVNIAAIATVLLMLMGEVSQLFSSVRTMFGL